MTDDFDKDFGVDEWHGTNAFIRDGDRCSAPTSSTTVATSKWETPGTTSTSLPSGVRRSGKTRRRAPSDPAVQVVDLARRIRERRSFRQGPRTGPPGPRSRSEQRHHVITQLPLTLNNSKFF